MLKPLTILNKARVRIRNMSSKKRPFISPVVFVLVVLLGLNLCEAYAFTEHGHSASGKTDHACDIAGQKSTIFLSQFLAPPVPNTDSDGTPTYPLALKVKSSQIILSQGGASAHPANSKLVTTKRYRLICSYLL